jgi:hypothetical protein
LGASGLHGPRRVHDILFRVDGAGASDGDQTAVADLHGPHPNDGVLFFDLAAGELVRLADADYGVDAVQNAEFVQQLRVYGAEHCHNAALNAPNQVVLEAEFPDMFLYSHYLGLRGLRFHYDDHVVGLLPRGWLQPMIGL